MKSFMKWTLYWAGSLLPIQMKTEIKNNVNSDTTWRNLGRGVVLTLLQAEQNKGRESVKQNKRREP